ncbi:MAG: response regulator [Legionellales bacterium]|nr:response regulator [Legionellales bacterium]
MNPHSKILIVDDDALMRELLCDYLQNAGYSALTAACIEEGWQIILNQPQQISTLLLDRMLPDGDGLSLLKRVREIPTLAGLPIITISAVGEAERIREGLQAGTYYYLTKPVNSEVLITLIQTAQQDWQDYQSLHHEIANRAGSMLLLDKAQYRFKTLAESRMLAVSLSSACPHPNDVVIGLSDLLLNAIEHGNLGITYREKTKLLKANTWQQEIEHRLQLPENQDKWVTVIFQRDEKVITITIIDQGVGFDWEPYLDMTTSRAAHSHGRGIALANQLSFDELIYLEPGNSVIGKIFLTEDE